MSYYIKIHEKRIEYFDAKANVPVRVSGILEKELSEKASKVLALQRKGAKLIFPDVLEIERKLVTDLHTKRQKQKRADLW